MRIDRIIEETINKILQERRNIKLSRLLYHKSPISCRKSILKKGLIPSVGSSYKAHWDDRDDLTPYIFLYDHNLIKNGEYDSTYDDDVYAIDVSQLDKKHISNDMDKTMKGCFTYDIPIPPSAIKLIYKGSKKDSDETLMFKHRNIYESVDNTNNAIFKESVNEYGDITISAYDPNNENNLMGYSILVIHEDIYSLDSEISETDSYETASEVIRRLDYNKPIIELADVDVKREYRNMGVSKMLLEYVLNKYGNKYQFYLRVCPTSGVDEETLARSVMKYGFIEVDNTENGTFLIRK